MPADNRKNIKINDQTFQMLLSLQTEMTQQTGKRVPYDEIIQKAVTLLRKTIGGKDNGK
ncbi:hypothetical protein OYT88_12440 [Sporolactobacillus sp. CQH2019]|uniref:hypothetical protein n=1 Tax=Sporolactobacillus sp. CQH2019 TaxID=3023512 RepID=UPI002367B528|nr:hypothetical protein [Sporolactobacillus sp. CQH2019]MDD9149350.1 hypothetical protein [Sporolactobacillus sp. CQH2019]